ncbi:MAG: DUF4091 domain-containing protein [Candidatus Omnitrophica bacterium]|nr:DUF4091 domain-containing protein [Candidatus Omnitrophota bacterium]
MERTRVSLLFFLLIGWQISLAVDIKQLPQEEQSLADTVDPWGLAFSDQLTRFNSYFEKFPGAEFVLGLTHNLVKLWPNKYWFRGVVIGPGGDQPIKNLWAVTGSTASFQLAILPKIGAPVSLYTVSTYCPLPVAIFREEFLSLESPPYPRFQSQEWPDPLVPERACELSGVQAGIFLIEIKIPPTETRSRIFCEVRVTARKGQTVKISIPVEIVRLNIQPKNFPLVAWFERESLSDAQFEQMCLLALEHHLQPLSKDYLRSLWRQPEKFEQFIRLLLNNGQRYFQVSEVDQTFYDFLKRRNWLPYFLVYSNVDEPSQETFFQKNIPYAERFRQEFPGLRIFLASEYHPQMERGCDIWLTDLSSSKYDPRTFKIPEKPEMWHYFCHLPIRYQMRAPLTLAPNMLIDNPALEHRLAVWMSWHFGARGIFVWAGNREWKSLKNFWETGNFEPPQYKYPYGGKHHGNGFLVYPPLTADSQVIPSLRLKILRDAMEDLAIFNAIKKQSGATMKEFINPVPEVFIHPHYYDHLPETLLLFRDKLLSQLRKIGR